MDVRHADDEHAATNSGVDAHEEAPALEAEWSVSQRPAEPEGLEPSCDSRDPSQVLCVC